VHAVQHMFHPPAKIDAWPTSDHRSRLVFIVKDIDRDIIEGALNSYLAMDF
jgi:G3E family GTPase